VGGFLCSVSSCGLIWQSYFDGSKVVRLGALALWLNLVLLFKALFWMLSGRKGLLILMIEHEALLIKIQSLPETWHGAGTVPNTVLEKLADLLASRPPAVSLETGTGRTTLLFSHFSGNHTVFCVDDLGNGNSYAAVRDSDLLNVRNTNFVLGPTQITLKNHVFTKQLDFAFLDGPHAYPFVELEYYFVYPHLRSGALFVLDDIHIPTIFRLFEFLKEDRMFTLDSIIEHTAIFVRTDEQIFSPLGDGWWLQEFNKKRFPVIH
jgi:hypothetical protein